jgi:SAM-dependent methyltransferase
MTAPPYVGGELEIFAYAANWKEYWSTIIRPYVSGDVLEVGAGLGANTEYVNVGSCSSWTCLEPDPQLAARIKERIAANRMLSNCRVEVGTIEVLGKRSFDTIIYIDVLEHIEDDRGELARAAERLRTNGKLIVLAPAHQWLYTPFDSAIGHFRRYNTSSLVACSPASCSLKRVWYLDSVGLLVSLGNLVFLRQSSPELKQILLWDRFLVRLSRRLDPLACHSLGKSILGIWEKL